MSVIIENRNGEIWLLTKGADSVIMPRLSAERSPALKKTEEFVEDYAKEGLRTLFLAQKKLERDEYNQW